MLILVRKKKTRDYALHVGDFKFDTPNWHNGLPGRNFSISLLAVSVFAFKAARRRSSRPELKPVAVISKVGGGTLNPDAGDLALTMGWGHGGKDDITMPGKGKVITRDYTPEELAAIRDGAGALGLTPEQALEHLGETTCDVYLNESAYWQNIPARV